MLLDRHQVVVIDFGSGSSSIRIRAQHRELVLFIDRGEALALELFNLSHGRNTRNGSNTTTAMAEERGRGARAEGSRGNEWSPMLA